MINHPIDAPSYISRLKKNFKDHLFRILLHKVFYPQLPLFTKLFKDVAETGKGTNLCLNQGFLPLMVNYYSPIPDIPDLEKRMIWGKKSDLPGIDFQPEKQLELLKQFGHEYGAECDWPLTATAVTTEFYLKNSSFSYGCAAALHTMIRHFKPKHFIEIGSGHSSKVISKALEMNKADDQTQVTEYLVIDPYPGETVTKQLPSISKLVKDKVECTDPALFNILGANDILFVDSGHTVRTGSDVNFVLLEVLPRLRPGVIVHFHDINLPYEYPKVYFTNPQFRMFWTEAYLLQAFLAFNKEFEILLAMNYLQTNHMDEFCNAFPRFNVTDNWSNSGSFWIRRKD